MAARLGNVLYWLGCVCAALFAAIVAIIAIDPGRDAQVFMALFAMCALLSWVVGRALRYILAGT